MPRLVHDFLSYARPARLVSAVESNSEHPLAKDTANQVFQVPKMQVLYDVGNSVQ